MKRTERNIVELANYSGRFEIKVVLENNKIIKGVLRSRQEEGKLAGGTLADGIINSVKDALDLALIFDEIAKELERIAGEADE